MCHKAIYFAECDEIKRRLHNYISIGELQYPIKCLHRNCGSSFSKVGNLIRHLQMYNHQIKDADSMKIYGIKKEKISVESYEVTKSLLADSVDMTQDQQIINIQKQPLKDVLYNEALALCASLHANSAIPHYIVPNVMTAANSMLNTLSQSIGNAISHYLLPLGEKRSCNK